MKRDYSKYIGAGAYTSIVSFAILVMFLFEFESFGYITPRHRDFKLRSDDAEFLLIALFVIFFISSIFTFCLWLWNYFHTEKDYFEEYNQESPSVSEVIEETKYTFKVTPFDKKEILKSTLKTLGYTLLLYVGLILLTKAF